MPEDNPDKAEKPKTRRPGAIRAALCLFALLLSTLALLAGCKSEPPMIGPKTGYMSLNGDSVTYVEWAQAEQKLQGDITVLDRKPDGKVERTVFFFKGTLNGERVSLTLNSSASRNSSQMINKTILGALDGNTLTLTPVNDADSAVGVVLVEYRRATPEEFADAALNLQKSAKTTKTAK
jgi:hypothetical protein